MSGQQSDDLLDCLKRVAAALRDEGIPFALGGGLSAYARGGPPSENDVDLLIREEDWEGALKVLHHGLGLTTDVPPEGWLVKAYDGNILIDLIFRPSGLVIDDEFLARCDEMSVKAVTMKVMPVNDLLASKLLSWTEHHLDYTPSARDHPGAPRADRLDRPACPHRTQPVRPRLLHPRRGAGDRSSDATARPGGRQGSVMSHELPIEHVLAHVRDALATDGRVGSSVSTSRWTTTRSRCAVRSARTPGRMPWCSWRRRCSQQYGVEHPRTRRHRLSPRPDCRIENRSSCDPHRRRWRHPSQRRHRPASGRGHGRHRGTTPTCCCWPAT